VPLAASRQDFCPSCSCFGLPSPILFEKLESVWRDDSDANQQLIAWSRSLKVSMQIDDLLRSVEHYPLLRARQRPSGSGVKITTPERAGGTNWIALLYLDEKGQLARVEFGTEDYVGPLDRPQGMPAAICFAAKQECEKWER